MSDVNDAPDENLSEEDLTDLLNYDPFDSGGDVAEEETEVVAAAEATDEEVEASPAEDTPAEDSQEYVTQPFGQTEEPIAAQAPPAPVEPSPEIQQLREQVSSLTAALATRAESTPAAKTDAAAKAAEEEKPFAFNLPADLVEAIGAEDVATRGQALEVMTNGIANSVYKHIRDEISKEFSERVPVQIQRSMDARNEQEEVFNDFYGTFPQYKDPAIRGLIVNVASQVLRESGAQAWSPQIRDAVGARVAQVLSSTQPQQTVPQQTGEVAPPATPTPTPQPPKQFGGNSRPSTVSSGDDFSKEIEDTLFGGYGVAP